MQQWELTKYVRTRTSIVTDKCLNVGRRTCMQVYNAKVNLLQSVSVNVAMQTSINKQYQHSENKKIRRPHRIGMLEHPCVSHNLTFCIL